MKSRKKTYHQCPKWLWGNKDRVEMFRRLSKLVVSKFGYNSADIDALAMLADGLVVYRNLSIDIIKRGELTEGTHGVLVKNPSFSLQTGVYKTISPLMAKFGLTVFDRTKLSEIKNEVKLADIIKVPK